MQPAPFLRTYRDGNVRQLEVFGHRLEADGWRVEVAIDDHSGRARFRATILEQGQGSITLGVTLRLPRGGHVAIPGAVYGGNRFRRLPLAYPCILNDSADFRPDLPTTTSLIPALPRIQLLAGDASMPAIGVAEPGVWIRAPHRCLWGSVGLEVVEAEDLRLSILFPGVREGMVYNATPEGRPSPDEGVRPAAGDRLEVDLQLEQFRGGSPVHLYRRLFDFWGNGPDRREHLHEFPFNAARELIEDKHNTHYWNEADGYYMLSDGSWEYGQWQAGWVGGGIQMYGLAYSESPVTRDRTERMLDFVTGPAQHPGGLWWSLKVGEEFVTDMVGMDYGHDWHLVRRSGDVLYFLAKTIAVRQRQQQEVKPSWIDSVVAGADRLCRIWESQGRLGHFVAQDTGEIRSGDTTSGAIVPAALGMAFRLTGESRYIDQAAAICRYFLRHYLEEGFTNGGPGEAAQAPDSESAFALMESCVELARITGDEFWWSAAEDAACHAASWVMDYDFTFPHETTFGRLGIQTCGSVFANAQNKHSAPGICTLSGAGLLHLARRTGNLRFLELLAWIARGTTQYLSRPDRPIFGMIPGASCERVNTSDWEGDRIPVGEGFAVDCWSSISALLSTTELPGVYVSFTRNRTIAIDHLNAHLERRVLTLENRTAFEARTTLLVDEGQELAEGFTLDLPIITVPPHESVTLAV